MGLPPRQDPAVQTGYEEGGYEKWIAKLDKALDEAKIAAANAMAHSLESTTGLIAILDLVEEAKALVRAEPARRS